MDGHGALRKLATFKGVVGIVLLQTPIFTALAEHRVFHGTQYVSIVDFIIGTPSFLVCVEMFLVTLLFLWSFSASEYKNLARSQNLRSQSVGKALFDVVDISDILKGCWYMCQIIVGGGLGSGAGLDRPSGPMKGVEEDGSTVELQPYLLTQPPLHYPQQQGFQQLQSMQPQQYQQQQPQHQHNQYQQQTSF